MQFSNIRSPKWFRIVRVPFMWQTSGINERLYVALLLCNGWFGASIAFRTRGEEEYTKTHERTMIDITSMPKHSIIFVLPTELCICENGKTCETTACIRDYHLSAVGAICDILEYTRQYTTGSGFDAILQRDFRSARQSMRLSFPNVIENSVARVFIESQFSMKFEYDIQP